MKRIIASFAAVLVALTALCQSFNDSTVLTQQQWQHALAIIAQNTALNDGYGQATADFQARNPEGYTLDDLNAVYEGKKNWNETYSQLKKRENDGGNVATVKQLAGGLAGGVATELRNYVEAKAAETAAAPEQPVQVDSVATEPLPELQEQPQQSSWLDYHTLVDIALALLALGALAFAWTTRRSLDKLRDNYIEDIGALNNNMQNFANDVAAQIDDIKLQSKPRVTQQPQFTEQPRGYESPVEPFAPVRQQPQPRKAAVKTLYLSKPDENETFMRATDDFELGNSIFVLTTPDGVHGEYNVIDNRDVHRFALMMPGENLTRACSGHAIQMANGMTRIVTDRAGEAIYENGQWHVSVKAIIHYE